MKIICNKSNLVKGVSIVSKAVPSKNNHAYPGMYPDRCNNGYYKADCKRYGTGDTDRDRGRDRGQRN